MFRNFKFVINNMQTLLVATDFSESASNAVGYAASLAKHLGARLVLVNAFPIPLAGGDAQIPIDLSIVSDASIQSLEEIKTKLIRENYNFDLVCYSAMGTAYSVIEEACNRFEAELVILGMTGEAGRLKEHLIGSTAVSVGRDFKLPVLVIPSDLKYKPIHHVSFACDIDKLEESALLYSVRYFAKLFDATLELVTVQKGGSETKWRESDNYSFIEKTLNTVKHKQVFIKEDDVATALEYYFKFHHTDVVIVNPKKHSFFNRLFSGSITKHLAFHSQVPLLIIH